MSIVLSPKTRIVVTTEDTTHFNYASNNATEIRAKKDISLNFSNTVSTYHSPRVATSQFVVDTETYHVDGFSDVSLSFTTYLKSFTETVGQQTNTYPTEELLWKGITGGVFTHSTQSCSLGIQHNLSTTLLEFYIYLVFDDGSFYKIERAVIEQASITAKVSEMPEVTWSFRALSITYHDTTTLTGRGREPVDNELFYSSKKSTFRLNIGGTNYLGISSILAASIVFTNNIQPVMSAGLGVTKRPKGFIYLSRDIIFKVSLYLNNTVGNNTTSDLVQFLSNPNLSLAGLNQRGDTTIRIGGSATESRVDLSLGQGRVAIDNLSTGIINTLDLSIYANVYTVGDASPGALIFYNF